MRWSALSLTHRGAGGALAGGEGPSGGRPAGRGAASVPWAPDTKAGKDGGTAGSLCCGVDLAAAVAAEGAPRELGVGSSCGGCEPVGRPEAGGSSPVKPSACACAPGCCSCCCAAWTGAASAALLGPVVAAAAPMPSPGAGVAGGAAGGEGVAKVAEGGDRGSSWGEDDPAGTADAPDRRGSKVAA